MREDIREILIDQKTLNNKVKELGSQITKDYYGKFPLLVCILKGAILFVSDLVQNIDTHVELDFMDVSSYGNSTKSSGVVRILKDLNANIEGRDVLVVEDIVDSGLTLSYLLKYLEDKGTNSIKVCTLLEKPARRIAEVDIEYVGFEVPDEFVVGYGLDYAEKYRNLPYIGILKEEIYNKK